MAVPDKYKKLMEFYKYVDIQQSMTPQHRVNKNSPVEDTTLARRQHPF